MKMSFALIGLLALASLGRAEFSPSFQYDRRGLYENQQVSSKSDWGQTADMYLVPAFSWGRQALIPVIVDLEEGRGLVIEETYFVRRTTYLLKPLYRFQQTSETAWKLWGTAKRTVNAEKDDTVPYKGLYDYEEFGVGAGLDKKLERFADSVAFGYEFQHRHYPNWRYAGPTIDGKNFYEKDYFGHKVNLDAKGNKDGRFPWTASLTYLMRDYTDAYPVTNGDNGNSLGVPDVSGPLRLDNLYRLLLSTSTMLHPGWVLDGSVGIDYNTSNMNAADVSALVVTSDINSYHSTTGTLGLTWQADKDAPRATVTASLNNRVYLGRPIRWGTGEYTQGTEADLEQDYSFDFDYPIGKGFSVVGSSSWTNVLSNQDFIAGVRNTYDLFSASLGMKYKL
jgi:hypothetical protein